MGIWVVSTFDYYEYWCDEHLCMFLFGRVSFLFGVYLGVELLGHMVTLYLTF